MSDQSTSLSASTSAITPDEAIEPSSEEILRRLLSGTPSLAERRRLIIEAEVLDFEPHQLERLTSALLWLIGECRESNDPEDRVAVGSAIRKCIATLQTTEALAYAAELLEAGPRTPVPLESELELTKMVVRKLTANPPKEADFLPELADRLLEITRTYLNPRLLGREKYGAITLNAILGLVLLRSRHVPEVLGLVSELKVPWFKPLLVRRVRRVRQELQGRHSGEFPEGLIGSLKELESQLV